MPCRKFLCEIERQRNPERERGGRNLPLWVLVVALALIVNVGYGAIFYSFSVLIGEDAAASEFPRAVLSAALGLGLISSGILALLVGAVCDVLGPRRVFLAGALLGALGLAAFSQARS